MRKEYLAAEGRIIGDTHRGKCTDVLFGGLVRKWLLYVMCILLFMSAVVSAPPARAEELSRDEAITAGYDVYAAWYLRNQRDYRSIIEYGGITDELFENVNSLIRLEKINMLVRQQTEMKWLLNDMKGMTDYRNNPSMTIALDDFAAAFFRRTDREPDRCYLHCKYCILCPGAGTLGPALEKVSFNTGEIQRSHKSGTGLRKNGGGYPFQYQ